MRRVRQHANHLSTAASLAIVLMIFGVVRATAQVGLPPAEESEAQGDERADLTESEVMPRLRGHRENYILIATYADDPNGNVDGFREVKHLELKFQLSLRYRIVDFGLAEGKLVFGYTNTSFWQIYNWNESAPFRTTDHEPELFYEWRAAEAEASSRRVFYRLGVVHESNGEGVRLSRSWNRLFGEYLVASSPGACRQTLEGSEPKPGTCAVAKAWWDLQHDDIHNPDIDKYMGYFELRGEHVWKLRGRPRLALMLRNNLRSDGNRGAAQVDLSRGLPWRWEDLRVRLQYFHGYGESLIDYDHNSNRIGVGLELTY